MEQRTDKVRRLAKSLIETGRCGLPITMDDVARRVASHENHKEFITCVMRSSPAISQGFILNRAIELVEDFLPLEEVDHA